jgi:hypothetical protein
MALLLNLVWAFAAVAILFSVFSATDDLTDVD